MKPQQAEDALLAFDASQNAAGGGCQKANGRCRTNEGKYQVEGAGKGCDLLDFFRMGVHIKLLGGKGLPQWHHMVKAAGVQAESGVDALALRAWFACPAVLRSQFGHGAAITVVFRCFHEG